MPDGNIAGIKDLRSQLNGKNKVQAIKTHTLPVIRFKTGIINWLKKIEVTDINITNASGSTTPSPAPEALH